MFRQRKVGFDWRHSKRFIFCDNALVNPAGFWVAGDNAVNSGCFFKCFVSFFSDIQAEIGFPVTRVGAVAGKAAVGKNRFDMEIVAYFLGSSFPLSAESG